MCGIGGIIRMDGGLIEDSCLESMLGHLQHRGPDGTGVFRDRIESESGHAIEIAFVHARLSIIDHEGGKQPMLAVVRPKSPNQVAVVFNGCVYNHRELRTELQTEKKARFRSDHSDTEVIVRAITKFGLEETPERLDGMFAYAAWERATRRLTLVRDRAGEKPLYWWQDHDTSPRIIIFGSTIPAVMHAAMQVQPRAVRPRRTHWWKHAIRFGYCRDAYPFERLYQVAPGSMATLDLSYTRSAKITRYWEPSFPDQEATNNAITPLTTEVIDDRLRSAVHSMLDADVPIGCFLSGGIDSPLITRYASEKMPELRTFTVRMPVADFDESEAASEVAKHLGVSHTILDVEPDGIVDDLTDLVAMLGQPFGDSSILPTYWVSKATREHVKVALSGDGGDELFLGYERGLAAQALRKYASWLRLIPEWPFNHAGPRTKVHKLARLGSAARHGGYEDLVAVFPEPFLDRLVPSDPYDQLNRSTGRRTEGREHDFNSYLPGDLLRKVDTASMAVALEVRAPFLDRALMDTVIPATAEQLLVDRERKGLLKVVARMYLPDEIIDRPKHGFAIPIGEWFRTDFGGIQTLLLDLLNSSNPFGGLPLNLAYVRQLIREHLNQGIDHSQRLFMLLTLCLWSRDH